MRHSRRSIAFVCAAGMLLLLVQPLQAAPRQDDRAPLERFETWLGSTWDALVSLVSLGDSTLPPSSPEDGAGTGTDGGPCIDPNGCPN